MYIDVQRSDNVLRPLIPEIKKRRTELNLSKSGLSRNAGLPSNAVSRIESNVCHYIHPIRAKAIAEALGCSLYDAFEETSK